MIPVGGIVPPADSVVEQSNTGTCRHFFYAFGSAHEEMDVWIRLIHFSSAELTKVIAIFYAKMSAERLLNINKTMTKQNKTMSFKTCNLFVP